MVVSNNLLVNGHYNLFRGLNDSMEQGRYWSRPVKSFRPGTCIEKLVQTTGRSRGSLINTRTSWFEHPTEDDDVVERPMLVSVCYKSNMPFPSTGDSGSIYYAVQGCMSYPVAIYCELHCLPPLFLSNSYITAKHKLQLSLSNINNNNQESQEPGNEMNCDGISRIIGKTNYVGCATQIDGDPSKRIYIKEKVDGHLKKLHFCNIDHCLRYIILHYVTGKKSAKGTNTESRSRSLTADGEDEDEEEEEEDGEDEETQSTPPPAPSAATKKNAASKTVAKPAAKQAKKSSYKRKQSGNSSFYCSVIERLPLFQELVGIEYHVYCSILESYEKVHLQQNVLPAEDALLLVFLHFRHYPNMILLSSIFGISPSTGHRYRKKIQEFLYHLFSPEISMMTPERRQQEAGYLFLTPKIPYVLILDGTEQPTYNSSSPDKDSLYYSAFIGYFDNIPVKI
ncbi:hypothetical protein PPL_10875 [Heterostelium album PN500]|uniref:Transposase Helix-turn-helix domain-containing protein n=1 Tax=Heterostelium pallidum (strain ATCC 26659 / Pp 5 / PN500) TaxID=670386 RepID=D3BS83_HETP5|nr:hypothetical protein PPL_10875 [Heterostelium album PN500]EFA75820.1 hypothetical protein PPL_10875 [Heterostelium album PN500]|eukprot:XP_020427954.1 hypothetical protein PPL_10875 [Heterostelium album PN500]